MRYLRWAIMALVLLAGISTAHALPRDEAAALFFKANELYKQEKYDEAIADYEGILRQGLASWTVYYNLGNSYFKKGQLGRAILNYARAQELEPRDADLKANYRYALSHVAHDLTAARSLWEKLWDSHLDFYTADEMLIIIFALLFFLVLAHVASLYTPRPLLRKNGLFALLILGIMVYGYGFKLKLGRMENAAVAVAASEAKYEPLENATAYFQLPEGGRVKVIKEEAGWAKIEREDGKLGWVKRETVEPI